MIRLGLRLAFLGGRWSVVPTALTAVAVAFGTAILLYALSFEPALDVRYDRGAWRDTPGPRGVAEELAGTTLISLTDDHVEGRAARQDRRRRARPRGPGPARPDETARRR